MLIAHISDFHVTTLGSKVLGRIDTNGHLAAAVVHLNRLTPRPDLVVMTGDLVNDGRAEEYAALARLLEPLAIPLRAIPGNHDDRAGLRTLFGSQGWLPLDGPFLHYAETFGPLRLIALDSIVPGRPEGRLCPERLAWIEARLAEAEREAPEQPILVMMHHPPMPSGIGHMDAMRCLDGEGLARVLAGHSKVERILCGHLHRPMTARWAGTVVCVAASTAHHVALDLDDHTPARWTREPPTVALHQWAPDGLVTHLSYVGVYPPHPFT